MGFKPIDILEKTANEIANIYSNPEIENLFNKYSLKFEHNLQYDDHYNSKKTKIVENFSKFREKELYNILKDILNNERFSEREIIDKALSLLVRYNADDFDDYESEIKESIKETKHWLKKYPNAYTVYKNGVENLLLKNNRNVLDDLRLSLELLIKEYILKNNKSLEKNIDELNTKLKEKGVDSNINTLYRQVIDFYSKYQNDSIKHNLKDLDDNVNFIFEISNALIKYLCKISF